MRKGLKLTLMTVAIALISVRAMAMAPVINDLPAVVVGNSEPITGGSQFVFIDAFDLNSYASDSESSTSELLWSYTGPGTAGASKYLINGVPPINLNTIDPTSPTTAQCINLSCAINEWNPDGKKSTVTIRNIRLSPLPTSEAFPGQSPAPTRVAGVDDVRNKWSIIDNYKTGMPGIMGPGINNLNDPAGETEPVMFFCSDGAAFTSQTVFFYSAKSQADRLSQVYAPVKNDKFTTFWSANKVDSSGTIDWMGNLTSTSVGGLCLIAGANGGTQLTGDNMGSLASPMPYFSLTKNVVYRIKLMMNGSQLVTGATPFWDFILENYNPATGMGLNAYSMDTLVFDNTGGANSVTAAGMVLTMYWTPAAVQVAQWNGASTGIYQSKYAANKDPRLRFRILDLDSVPAAFSNVKGGTLCIQNLIIDQSDLGMCRVLKNLYNASTVVQNNGFGTGNVEVMSLNPENVTVTWGSGTVTVKGFDHWNGFPPAPGGELAHNGQLLEIIEIRPAKDLTYGDGPPFATSSWADNWPIAWKSGQILRLQVGISAPDANSVTHPMDAIFLSFATMTNEVNMDTFVTTNQGLATPQQGAPQTYQAFFYTSKETVAPDAQYHNLRWRIRFINHPSTLFPSGNPILDGVNTGGEMVSSVKVDQVTFSRP